ncbi:TetR/AcrR family transcriptional regulator [Mycobacterium sp. ACS4331]|uniref:TetR/AcrR family transcriptional regulator n=1 Tax=Mycobacterium sp. ACS4331 TaxID=1834121 RepID=UPI0007FCBC6C|nr:TetR/AcrR family transcriptional regulator [Mycobacterium sp. ACS4331]OBF17548.1 TetR family transcriptional regulator [Mycobacterium sp. ACS4331]
MQHTATGRSKPNRPRSRRGKGEQLRAEILAAVNGLLDEWGSDEKLTMRAVAEQVGVAAPSIYLHFADKSELVWAALADKYAQLAELMRAAAEAADGGPRDRLRAQVHAYCRFALDHPGHYRLMYQVHQPAPATGKPGHHPARQVSRRLRRALTECAEAGHRLTLPLHQCAHTLWTGLHGMVSIQQTMATVGGTPDGIYALADGLVDALVSAARGAGETIPASTEIDRIIAASVVDDE